jgi:quaternary ammonium compound-resistance protein SugE
VGAVAPALVALVTLARPAGRRRNRGTGLIALAFECSIGVHGDRSDMAWAYLVLAGFFEVGFTSCLKLSEGFTRVLPSLGFLVFSIASFWFLNKAVATVPLGTAYAVWTGIGACGTAIVGMVFFRDPVSAGRLFFLVMIVVSIVGLKWASPE